MTVELNFVIIIFESNTTINKNNNTIKYSKTKEDSWIH